MQLEFEILEHLLYSDFKKLQELGTVYKCMSHSECWSQTLLVENIALSCNSHVTYLCVDSIFKSLILTLCILMDSSFWLDTINFGIVH